MIPRNHRVEAALEAAAEEGDLYENLNDVLSDPMDIPNFRKNTRTYLPYQIFHIELFAVPNLLGFHDKIQVPSTIFILAVGKTIWT